MPETTNPTEPSCLKCDDTGWARHPWRDGYVWCECARGQRFKTAHQGKRAEKAKRWERLVEKARRA